MDDEELAESVAKRKQAEAHGYVPPATIPGAGRTKFGDGLEGGGDDEDDFFSMKRQVVNGEDEDFGDEAGDMGAGSGAQANGSGASGKKKSGGGSKRKAPAECESLSPILRE